MSTATMTKPQHAESYTRFLRSLDLAGIALTESRFHGDRSLYISAREHRIVVNWEAQQLQMRKGSIEARTQVTVRISDPKVGHEPFFDLAATFTVTIRATAPISRKFAERFSDSEMRLLVWPYFREYVSSICGRMHVPPFFLPLGGGRD